MQAVNLQVYFDSIIFSKVIHLSKYTLERSLYLYTLVLRVVK